MSNTDMFRRSRSRKWLFIAVSVSALLGTGAILLAMHWPFGRSAVVRSLAEAFSGTVDIRRFEGVFFPYPGCILHGVTIRRQGPRHSALIEIGSLRIRSDYHQLLAFSKNLAAIHVADVQIHIRNLASNDASPRQTNRGGMSRVIVDEFLAQRATLVFEPGAQGAEPYKISVDVVRLRDVGAKRRFKFETALHLAKPPGDVHAHGSFGPWNGGDPFETPVSGSYSFERADLAFANGIAGILASHGAFEGQLRRIEVSGSAEVPNFELTGVRHAEPVRANFRTVVNGQTGDVSLKSVEARLRHTTIRSRGEVAGRVPRAGKTVLLDVTSDGPVEDVLHLFGKAEPPAMTGSVELHTRVVLPPGEGRFLRKLQMDGEFEIRDARFTNAKTREGLDRLSERASGEKGNEPDPRDALGNLGGKVAVAGGVAKITALSIAVPGVRAKLAGTYHLISTDLDLRGNAQIDVKLSKTQGGAKSFFLKVLDPFFNRSHGRGSEVPIKITGRNGHTSVGMDVARGRK